VQDVSSHKRTSSTNTLRGVSDRARRASSSSITLDYGTHLSLFVVFDKKAGWIRLADAAVGELELHDFGNGQLQRHGDSIKHRSRVSLEGSHAAAKWIPPVCCELSLPDTPGVTSKVYILTRGKQTHIVRSPLRCSSPPPLYVVAWNSAPISISARICEPFHEDLSPPPFLQLIGFCGENGLEVQEIPLSSLGKDKRQMFVEEPIRAEEDFGGESGFLCAGGHWDTSDHKLHFPPQAMARSSSTSSAVSDYSFLSVESTELLERLQREEGIYGWCRKGVADWRVFWVGGLGDDSSDDF